MPPRAAGCPITHGHQDHAKGAAKLADRGMDLYATAGTFANITEIDRPYRKHIVHAGEQFALASWIVLPFETRHDAAEPCGAPTGCARCGKFIYIIFPSGMQIRGNFKG